MKNYIQDGKVMTLAAPTGGVLAGNIAIVGALFAVATTSEAQGDNFEGAMEGVYSFAKKSADAPSQGAAAYWDDTLKEVTVTSTANTLVGNFVKAYTNGDTEAEVRLKAQ